jgi:O-antigen/teichoic acid export membrane protein
MPVLFHQAGDGSEPVRIDRAQRNTRRLLIGSLGLTALAVTIAVLLHRAVFGLLAAPQYRSVSALLPIMVLSGGMFACGQIASLAPLNRGKPKELVWLKIVTGIAGALFNIVGAYWKGLTGVVYAGAFFSVLYFLWTLLLFRGSVQRREKPAV